MDEKPEESATMGKNKNKTSNVQDNYQLKEICDKADGRLLIDYIAQNKNKHERKTLRKEFSVALRNDPDVVKVAMKALEGFNFSRSANRRVCIFLLESLFPIFGNDDSADVPLDVKTSAREIAKVWRNLMKKKRGLDCQAFLQLLISLRIVTDYEKDELLEILFPVSIYPKAPELCLSLGLSPDADFVDKVSKKYGLYHALKFAHALGMMDKEHHVGLLTSLLRDAEKDITKMKAHDLDASQQPWSNADAKKMAILKNIINHVERFGWQCDSFEDNLLEELRKLEQEKMDRKKTVAKKKAQKKRDGKTATKKKAQKKGDGKTATKKKAQEKEDKKEASEKKVQYKRRHSFELGDWLSERENYALKRAKHASLNETTGVAGGSDSSEASPHSIYRFQNKSRIIGHDPHPSALSAANRSSTGLAACAFTSALSMAAHLNDPRRCHDEYLSTLGTNNLAPIGSSIYSSGVPAGAFSVPLSNVAEVNYERRGEQSYMPNFGEVDKNHVRESVYRTEDLAKSSATDYKLNYAEIGTYPVRASAYATDVLANTSATQCHYERRGPELYTSTLGGGLTGSIGSSVYGSNPHTISSSDVNQGSFESGLGQYSGFAGRNMLPVVSSGFAGRNMVPVVSSGFAGRNMVPVVSLGYGSSVSTVPPSGFAGRNMVPVVSSGYGSTVYGSTVSTVSPSGFAGRNMVPVVSSGYGSTVSTVRPSGFAGRNMVPVLSSGYGPSVSTVPPSGFAGRNMVPVVSSRYGSSVSTVPPSGFAGRIMVPVLSSGYGSTVSAVPSSSVIEGHFERRRISSTLGKFSTPY